MATQFKEVWRLPVTRGLQLDCDTTEVTDGSFLTAHNFRFRNAAASLVGAATPLAKVASGQAIGHIGWHRDADQADVVVICTKDWVHTLGAANPIYPLNVAPYGALFPWDSGSLLGKIVVVNPAHPPQVINGVTIGNLPGGPNLANRVCDFAGHLILTRPAGNPQQIAGSGLNDATVWDYTDPATDADVMTIADGGDAVQLVKRCGDYLALYKEKSTHLVSYVGMATNIYSQQNLTDQWGAVSQFAAEDVGGSRHVFMGRLNFYGLTLAGVQGIGDRVWPFILKLKQSGQFTPLLETNVWCALNRAYDELIFSLPLANGGSAAVVYHFKEDAWSTRDFPYTAAATVASTSQAVPQTTIAQLLQMIGGMQDPIGGPAQALEEVFLAGDSAGNISVLDTGAINLAVGTLESGDTDYGDAYAVKQECGMFLRGDWTGVPPQVFVAPRMARGDELVWRGPFVPDYRGRVDYMATGRLFRHRIVKNGGTFQLFGYAPRMRGIGK